MSENPSAATSATETTTQHRPARRLRSGAWRKPAGGRIRKAGFLAGAITMAALALTSCLPTPQTRATGPLPFHMPASVAPSSTPRMAFAHYFTPYLISDNKPESVDGYTTAYLNPRGENGRHAAYGGLLRDRPLPRAPITSGNYQFIDMQTDIREAIGGGLDGFTLDLLSANPNSYNYQRDFMLMDAAAATNRNFKIMIMPDMVALRSLSNADLAAFIAKLATKPSAFRLPDGRLVVSPFEAENHPASWWAQTLSILRNQYHINVAFVPCFVIFRQYAPSFAPISYGFATWGNRNPMLQADDPSDAAYAHSLGKIWMQPVSVQDERPNQGIYDEAGNTENLRDSWQAAIDGKADWVQIPTWNDYSEGSQIAPSVKHGYTFLDLSSYFAVRWKTGAFPPIVRDTLYLTHRTQMYSALPSFPQTRLMKLRAIGTRARNTVELVSMLTAPATITVRVGNASYSYVAPAGLYAKLFPLGYGQVSASEQRAGRIVTSVTSPWLVTAHPYVQDLQYVGVTSGR